MGTEAREADRLALRFQAGDRGALGALYVAVEALLRTALRRWRRARLTAVLERADLEQQSWLILADLARRWRPDGGASFTTYLARAFPWALGRYVRSQTPERRAATCHVQAEAHDRVVALAGAAPDASGWDDALYCAELLHGLDPQARAALWLHAVEERSFTDLARALGVPRATAYDLYCRAVSRARRCA